MADRVIIKTVERERVVHPHPASSSPSSSSGGDAWAIPVIMFALVATVVAIVSACMFVAEGWEKGTITTAGETIGNFVGMLFASYLSCAVCTGVPVALCAMGGKE